MRKLTNIQKKILSATVVEIESLIVEGLLNRYLLAKGIYNENDLLNYKNGQVNSLLNETTLITEEQEILKVLNRPVTAENLNDLVENSSSKKSKKSSSSDN